MEPFTVLTATALPLVRDNVDTDAIIPSREMRTVSKQGLDGLFAGWRYRTIGGRDPDPAFVLNDPARSGAHILIAGANFGCGSSREHAVWALAEYGIRAIVAPSFSPIFRGNCIANGLVPVVLPRDVVDALAAEVEGEPAMAITVDLPAGEVRTGAGASWPFEIEPEARTALIEGLDPIEQTLRAVEAIQAFRAEDRSRHPWIYEAVERVKGVEPSA